MKKENLRSDLISVLAGIKPREKGANGVGTRSAHLARVAGVASGRGGDGGITKIVDSGAHIFTLNIAHSLGNNCDGRRRRRIRDGREKKIVRGAKGRSRTERRRERRLHDQRQLIGEREGWRRRNKEPGKGRVRMYGGDDR